MQHKEIIEKLINALQRLVKSNNQFDTWNYMVSYRLLWALENYPEMQIPSTRLGVVMDYESWCEIFTIRYEKDFLWVGLEGIERSGFGSDGYERIYYHYTFEEVKEMMANDINTDFGDISEWYTRVISCLEGGDYKIEMECHE